MTHRNDRFRRTGTRASRPNRDIRRGRTKTGWRTRTEDNPKPCSIPDTRRRQWHLDSTPGCRRHTWSRTRRAFRVAPRYRISRNCRSPSPGCMWSRRVRRNSCRSGCRRSRRRRSTRRSHRCRHSRTCRPRIPACTCRSHSCCMEGIRDRCSMLGRRCPPRARRSSGCRARNRWCRHCRHRFRTPHSCW